MIGRYASGRYVHRKAENRVTKEKDRSIRNETARSMVSSVAPIRHLLRDEETTILFI